MIQMNDHLTFPKTPFKKIEIASVDKKSKKTSAD